MNTVNQTFDWSRFIAVLRKEVVENRRTILFTLLGIYGLLTILMILGNLIVGRNELLFHEDQMHYTIVYLILGLTCAIASSLSFKKLTRKNGRVDMLTSPSSTLEKFLANALIYVFGFIVAFFVCAQLADLTRIAALWYFHKDLFVPGPINFLNVFYHSFSSAGILNALSGLPYIVAMGIIANCGLFLMGSVLWPRLSVLKTFAAVYAFEFAIAIIFFIIAGIVGEAAISSFGRSIFNTFLNGNMNYWAVAWYGFQIVLFWGLAWYLFKRKDVISLKWWK